MANPEVVLVDAGLGALGGGILAVKGYAEAWKAGEAFDAAFFLKSLVIPVVAGGLAGALAGDPTSAFGAGMAGKMVMEVASAWGVFESSVPPKPPVSLA